MAPAAVLSVLLLISLLQPLNASPTCADHPAYTAGLNPVLLNSWHIIDGNKFARADYHPRQTFYKLHPRDDPTSTRYHGLDFFWANAADGDSDRFIQLDLHRAPKVFLLLVSKYDPAFPSATLTGWRSEGYAERDTSDSSENTFRSGVHQQLTRYLPGRAYVFSKVFSSTSIYLPTTGWIDKNLKGINNLVDIYALIAESDGSPSKPPSSPKGVAVEIKPNQRCPDALHELWVTKNTDTKDADTNGRFWPTWHPMWDPCYWCAYDHEHGSSPKHLMNYEPKFGYTAWKNGREKEPHEGFKGVVFQSENYLIYYSLHAQTSSLRRIPQRLHTITFVVVDAKTKEILVELTHKGFFGALVTRGKKQAFVPLTEEDAKLMADLEADYWARNKRSVNVINVGNLNPEYSYQEPLSNVLRGRYEDWTTKPLCAARGRNGMITVDVTNPITGIKSVEEMDVKVDLGFKYGDEFIRSDGSSRLVVVRDFKMSEDDCIFKLKDIKGGMSEDGTFYTDAYGIKIMPGPSESSIRQYMKPGFEMKLDGVYEHIDPWVGMFEKDAHRGLSSYGFPIDPNVN